jgi:hypothetical protein
LDKNQSNVDLLQERHSNRILPIPNLKRSAHSRRRQSAIYILLDAACDCRVGGGEEKRKQKKIVNDKGKLPLKNQKNIMETEKGTQKTSRKWGNAQNVCILWIHFHQKVRT